MKAWRLVAILLVALSMAPVVGHFLEMPAKLAYDGSLWLTVSQTLYGHFGKVGGAFEAGAIFSTLILAFLARHRRPAFAWSALAAACVLAAHAAFWIWLAPVNAVVAGLTPETLPTDWMQLRQQWEYTHAGRAVLEFAALAALVISLLVETPEADPVLQPS